MQNLSWYKTGFLTCRTKTGFVPAPKPALWLHQSRLCADPKPTAPKPALCLLQNRFCADAKPAVPKPSLCLLQNRLCTWSKTSFVPSLNLLHPNRLCAYAQPLNLPHQNRICICTKLAFSFWINILTVSDVRCDCQGLGLVARIEVSILVFDAIQVLYWPVLGQIQFCSFDRRCKTCLDTKPVLYQRRFCSLTDDRQHTHLSSCIKLYTWWNILSVFNV